MKKSILKSVLLVAFAAFTSCKTTQVAKFTSVESLQQIKLNSSLDDVITVLGSKPYNILSSQIDGYSIFTYRYKFVERKINPKIINSKGQETEGKEVYNGKEQTLFLFFKANRLEALVTTEGRKDSPALIVLNNNLYTITKDREKYIILPSSTEDPKNIDMNPFSKKKKS